MQFKRVIKTMGAAAMLIAFSTGLIYLLNMLLFKKQAGEEKAKYLAFWLAVITAPYLFLLPLSLFY
ncbi:MAG: hypothetical protein IJR47_02360 [Clostridia bacterium]|nr:hypothetical protein [Clostridia bacterium]